MSHLDNIPDFIQRRISFLLDEATQPMPVRDLSVTWTLRAVWNYIAIGNPNAGPNQLKQQGRFRSRAAHNQSALHPPAQWFSSVIYEHEMTLSEMWLWMQTAKPTAIDVANKMNKWLPIIVTRDEDASLRLAAPQFMTRYEEAGIEVLFQTDAGEWVPRMPHVCGV